MNYNNAEVNKLWAEAANEPDVDKRNEMYGTMQENINTESPWGYLYEYNIAVAHSEDIQGYTSYPDGLIRFFQLSVSE